MKPTYETLLALAEALDSYAQSVGSFEGVDLRPDDACTFAVACRALAAYRAELRPRALTDYDVFDGHKYAVPEAPALPEGLTLAERIRCDHCNRPLRISMSELRALLATHGLGIVKPCPRCMTTRWSDTPQGWFQGCDCAQKAEP